jgi:hypothetical protein
MLVPPDTTQISEFFDSKENEFENILIPKKIIVALNESIKCYKNNCFVASFVMIKRVLEEISIDKSVKGCTLKSKIKNQKSKIENINHKISLPKELMEAINGISILNDVFFNIEAKDLTDTTEIEIWLIIDATKEIIKNLY